MSILRNTIGFILDICMALVVVLLQIDIGVF